MRCGARLRAWRLSFLLLFLLAACNDELPPEDCSTAEGSCESVACAPPEQVGVHVDLCSPIQFHSNPPTSGEHYGLWAQYAVYDTPVPRGLYLHSMEHGGVALLFNCSLHADCTALTQTLIDIRNAFGQDGDCDAGTLNRIVVTPDPDLDVPFAAAAWGHSLKAQCVDRVLVDDFIDAHYAGGPEDTCGRGIDPTDPQSGVTPDCGH
ncbi:MAG TPA: DUF3105 domain-containing protein [Polyangiaceae bacterium]|nr:DUF3105 domain-containing protein [Polyangiaceae bacterium]